MNANSQGKIMGPIEALREAGRRTVRQWRVLVLFYLSNLGAAALLIAPLAATLFLLIGHSLESERQFANLDLAWIVEAIQAARFGPLLLAPVFALVAALYLLWNTFLAGGAIGLMFHPRQSFFLHAARHFPRFLRLLLVSVPVYGLVLLINLGLAHLTSRFADDSMQAHAWVMLLWARTLLILLLLGLVNLVFDYAKILLAAEQRTGAFWAAIDGVRFILYRPGTTIGIFFLVQCFGIVVLLVYHGLTEVAPQPTMKMVVTVFVLRQAYTFVRFWLRLLLWNAEGVYYTSFVPAVVPDKPGPYASLSSTIVAPVPPSEDSAG